MTGDAVRLRCVTEIPVASNQKGKQETREYSA
jgi:hypothetical protein